MGFEPEYKKIVTTSFVQGKNDEVVLKYRDPDNSHEGSTMFVRDASGAWQAHSGQPPIGSPEPLIVEVRMSFRESPKLVARDPATNQSRVIWDPNPQLKNIDLGDPSLYRWTDGTGREWSAILYKPSHYVPGERYPLVIHRIMDSPSSGLPPAGASQAPSWPRISSAGIMVLHMRDCAGRGTPMEGPCNVMGYESAVAQLTKEGLIDPENVGIIGFSKTVFYVMEH